MDKQYISITEFCNSHHLEYSFIHSLTEFGLLETVVMDENEYIKQERIRDLERMVRLHFDLEINIQGIDAINHLLDRVSHLQNEIQLLRNRLSRYEN